MEEYSQRFIQVCLVRGCFVSFSPDFKQLERRWIVWSVAAVADRWCWLYGYSRIEIVRNS